jgi:dihydroorotate dehydrogenase electron transfer subunit
MNLIQTDAAMCCSARVLANTHISSGLIRIDLELEQRLEFEPGQFAMVNLVGPAAFVFSRPFSILAAEGQKISLLYRVVGRCTRAMKDLLPGNEMSFMGPLGKPFEKPRDDLPVVLIGGGVGLPPVWAWLEKYGRRGDIGFFGARDGADVPWNLLDERWQVSVDHPQDIPADRKARPGLVTSLVAAEIPETDTAHRLVMACGPVPLLKAAADLARERNWQCLVSLEEHMGCGYGACKGCVVPVFEPKDGETAWRNATCCQEGPVFRAESIDWCRYSGTTIEASD